MYSHLFVLSATLATAYAADWSYDGQADWPGECNATSSQQSPIDIDTATLRSCPSRAFLNWGVENVDELLVQNNGHSLVFLPADDSEFGALSNNFVASLGQHSEYILHSAHIHWGSEHTVDGHRSALEVHFVHYSADYANLSAAIADGASSTYDPYTLAVVGISFEIGESNPFFASVVHHADYTDVIPAGGQLRIGNDTDFDIRDLLPNALEPFYHYKGSLTTPGCDPIVNWHVVEETMTLSETELYALSLIRDSSDEHMDLNYRSAQDVISDVYKCNCEDGRSRNERYRWSARGRSTRGRS